MGAYGQEVASTITEVVAYDRRSGETVTLSAEECAFSYRHSRFKADPERYVVLRVRFRLEDAGGMSGPVKYAETARVLGVAPGERVPLAPPARHGVEAPRRQGHGAGPRGPRHLVGRLLLHQPDPRRRDVRRIPYACAGAVGDGVEPPAYPAGEGRTKTSAAWLIDKAGFTKGYGSGPARISTKHTLALTNRGDATTEDLLALAREVVAGVHDAFGITLVNEPVMVGVGL